VAGDPHRARPAGGVIRWDGRLVRLAQDCWPHYGMRVHALEIRRLSGTRYRERMLRRGVLTPGSAPWAPAGAHHLDAHPSEDGSWVAFADGR
jgi:hypothetical protein